METKRKIICICISILLVLILDAAILFGAVGSQYFAPHPYTIGLNDKQIREIRWTYFTQYYESRKNITKITIVRELGEYNGNIAIKLVDPYLFYVASESFDELTIDGVYIGRRKAPSIFMFYVAPKDGQKGKVIPLTAAYSQGYLTKSDLEEIAQYEKLRLY